MIGHLDVPRFDGRPLCAETDPELFYPEKGGSTKDAKKVCGLCEVSAQCLRWALDRDERHGVWGGLSERERRRLRRQPTAAAPVRQRERQPRALKPISHGTPNGYVTHRRRSEVACRPCLDAFNTYNRDRIAARARGAA